MRHFLLILVLTTTTLFAQGDPHAGQPATCNNYKDNMHKCECNKAMTCPEPGTPEDEKCQVYCRHDACKCVSPCDT